MTSTVVVGAAAAGRGAAFPTFLITDDLSIMPRVLL